MTFGENLRIVRESHGWSRFMLCLKVKEHGVKISESGIAFIENGTIENPRGKTKGILTRVLAELAETNRN